MALQGHSKSLPETGPLDPRLPHLDTALDVAAVAPRFTALCGRPTEVTPRLLKHVAGKRCVIGYTLSDGSRALGKMYRKDRARRHARHLEELASALRGPVRTPRLLALWEDLGMVLQEWAPGRLAGEYVDLDGCPATVERLGRALAAFHAAPIRVGPLRDLRGHLERTCRPGSHKLAEQFPELGAPLRHLEAWLLEREATLAVPVRPCHGDFGPRQVFLDGDTVTFVDLDGMCHSDPAVDVAAFRVGLQAHLPGRGDELARRFLAAYLDARGLDALPGLRHYEVFTWMRRAMMLFRKGGPERLQQIHLHVQRCERLTQL